MTNLTVSAGGVSTAVKVNRPRYSDLWEAYAEVGSMESAAVYDLVGGEAAELRRQIPDNYANSCALRMSRAFNYGGYKVPRGTIIKNKSIYRVRGSDGLAYILRVNDMIDFLKYNWGKPDLVMAPGDDALMAGKKGVIVIEADGWEDARGHVVLWNGEVTSDGSDYHRQDGEDWIGSTGVLVKISYWELKG
ncbi:type VI secretion system amidase effector protein Tae4 [Pseudomonas sp. KFB-139]|uniref:Type VI secretion system amidase effector protein Tae4 n=1 Tax=Pseudomonas serbiensis TaxID=3064350 RepID=A0ABT9CUL2_9PSED|nr:type VI secretion system amidase effector protein Tae4 [Pseudomonas sp. KFB-138]MDO7929186.1 type VI secretion system amidase effector protein Tae4 [Pseudomonas sp. KFB-138]